MARPGQLPHSSYGVRTTRQPLVTSLALLTKPQSPTTIKQHTQGSLRESFSLGGPRSPHPRHKHCCYSWGSRQSCCPKGSQVGREPQLPLVGKALRDTNRRLLPNPSPQPGKGGQLL